eukprot:CAMPEP_0195034638 /NCGR_PEP_ID=MMETSP0326_2-20130528/68311_1 /TAXON_ID=2866 ORGANISM="Crypthecodinium cohnii, Strain Seligo" /NCGR_SAMPLE_ID=MMETSP0326_2 /ASSEMBLY_ACC=CAM_ASM_000348 /LENGTH=35 /DNA_ID= /DNA_START= /DNA_END= /DNA_ORIENTATION=
MAVGNHPSIFVRRARPQAYLGNRLAEWPLLASESC